MKSLICLLLMVILGDQASSTEAAPAENIETAAEHIVYTEKPEGEEPEAYHIRTLASVLGSEEAAKGAIIYSYKHAASGFSAMLTPKQVSEISEIPGVLQVVRSMPCELELDSETGI